MKMTDKLERALAEINKRLRPIQVPWLVGGSTGLLLQGVPLASEPRDLDLYADDDAAKLIHQALIEFAVDEQLEDRSGQYRSILSHYLIHDVKVELVGGFVVSAYGCVYKVEAAYLYDKHGAVPAADYAACGLEELRLMPLEHELLFNLLRGRPDRYESIARALGQRSGSGSPQATAALDDLLSRSVWSEEFVSRLYHVLAQEEKRGL